MFTFASAANFKPAAEPTISKGPEPYKLIVVGDATIGKTTFAKRVATGNPIEDIASAKYQPTIGVSVTSPVTFETNKGKLAFSVWDTAGQEKFGGLRDGYFIAGEAAILCYDASKPQGFNGVTMWHRDVTRVCSTIPIAIVGLRFNECLEGAGVDAQIVADFLQKKGGVCKSFTVSTKDSIGLDAPFVWLLQQLTQQDDLALAVEDAQEEDSKKSETEEKTSTTDDKKEVEVEKKEEKADEGEQKREAADEGRIDLSPLEAAVKEVKEELEKEKEA